MSILISMQAVQPTTDPQIEALLNEALNNVARNTHEYQLGRLEATRDANKNVYREAFSTMLGVAEAFLVLLRTSKPEMVLKDIRIGLDYSTKIPAVLFILEPRFREQVKFLRDLARRMELYVWEHHHISGHIWILASESLEYSEINRDFPYYRNNATNAVLSTAS